MALGWQKPWNDIECAQNTAEYVTFFFIAVVRHSLVIKCAQKIVFPFGFSVRFQFIRDMRCVPLVMESVKQTMHHCQQAHARAWMLQCLHASQQHTENHGIGLGNSFYFFRTPNILGWCVVGLALNISIRTFDISQAQILVIKTRKLMLAHSDVGGWAWVWVWFIEPTCQSSNNKNYNLSRFICVLSSIRFAYARNPIQHSQYFSHFIVHQRNRCVCVSVCEKHKRHENELQASRYQCS